MSDKMVIAISLVWFVFGILVGFYLGGQTVKHAYRTQGIERGFAEYNKTTGAWQWKEAGK